MCITDNLYFWVHRLYMMETGGKKLAVIAKRSCHIAKIHNNHHLNIAVGDEINLLSVE